MRVFYAVRFFLGIISVIADAALVVALSRKYGKRLATYTLAMLCLASGCYFASTSMYTFWKFFSFVFTLHHILVLSCMASAS